LSGASGPFGLLMFLGGKCFLCGYKKCKDALEFHHLNSNQKEFGVSKDGLTRSWERVKNEIANYILVCSNCHRELHSQKRSLSK
jgi:predicted HNH restriction endonuclease